MSPIPVIVVGKMPQIASAVRKGLAPEYDVIHIITELEQALQDLPLLLSSPSKTSPDTATNLGSQNYGARPRIVAIGGGHSEENFEKMREACKSVDTGIIWLKRPVPKEANKPSPDEYESYGAWTAKSMKETLSALDLSDNKIEGRYYFD